VLEASMSTAGGETNLSGMHGCRVSTIGLGRGETSESRASEVWSRRTERLTAEVRLERLLGDEWDLLDT
jgi:hypothetical protein